MKSRLFFCTSLILTITINVHAQVDSVWHYKKCAVVLTYDDALNVHLDNVIPVLDSVNLKGTFYLSAAFPGSRDRIPDWKKAAAKGYELGNHTLFHPCAGNMPGREWVNPETDLSRYTVKRMVNEIRMTNIFLQALDGKKERTFAYPCGDTKIGDTSYIDSVKDEFIAARGVHAQMHTIDQVNLYDVDCYAANGETGNQLIDLVKEAMQKHSLLVFLFHGVGGGHAINVSLDAHSKLVHFLKQNEKDIWIAPMIEVVKHVKNYRQQEYKK